MSTLDYERAKNLVNVTLAKHLDAALARKTGSFTTIVTDINGTLLDSPVADSLDSFLCFAHRQGIPVRIASGSPDQPLPRKITSLLNQDMPSVGNKRPWAMYKEEGIKLLPAMFFEDDKMYATFIDIKIPGAYINPKAAITKEFFLAWETLGDEDKVAAFAPLVAAHRQYFPAAAQAILSAPVAVPA